MKNIVIVGTTSAIAIACAREWAAEGAQFFLVARNQERVEQVAADLARAARRRRRSIGSISTSSTITPRCSPTAPRT